MKLHISINGRTFEVASGNSIEINISGNQNFNSNTDTDTDESSYPAKRNITVVYTVTFYHRGRWVHKKANNKDGVKHIIEEYKKKAGYIGCMNRIFIKVQHFNENNEILYEKDLGAYEVSCYDEIISKKDLIYEANVCHRSIYRDGLNNIKWNIDELKNEFYLITKKYSDGLEVWDFPQDINLINSDITGFVYRAKQR